MSALFSKPKVPQVAAPPAPEPVPERSAEETATLAEEQRSRFFRGQGGRAMTMLTGGTGTSGGSAAQRFLGGAART